MVNKLFYLILCLFFSFALNAKEYNENYCIGYFEEVYWALDPIEDEDLRKKISLFFDENFLGAKKLNFNLYYDSNLKKFIHDDDQIDKKKYIKVNYPNFEIIILDAYISLFTEGDNYCPAFWDNCSDDSLESFFLAATDFSNTWTGEDNVLKFLEINFLSHQCLRFVKSSIEKKNFIKDLNILISQLTKPDM